MCIRDSIGSGVATVALYNLQGNLMASYGIKGTKAEVELPANITPGNYLLQIKLDNGEIMRKIITIR